MVSMRKWRWSTALQSPAGTTCKQEDVHISISYKNWVSLLLIWVKLKINYPLETILWIIICTFHNWATLSHVFFCMQLELASLLGSSLKSFFLSSPMRLVQSQVPLPRPSAFLFSHMEKETPQLLIALTRLMTCCDFSTDRFFADKQPSLSSHCIASSIKFSIKISVTRSIRWSSSRMMLCRGILRSGLWLQQ